MKISMLYCRTLTIYVVAAMLSGCGGSQPPIGQPGAMPQTSAFATHADRGKSWMLPEANADDLLYVADEGVGIIVYSYGPSRLRYVGLLGILQSLKVSVSTERRISSSPTIQSTGRVGFSSTLMAVPAQSRS